MLCNETAPLAFVSAKDSRMLRGYVSWLALAPLAIVLSGCYSQNKFATEACLVAFRSSNAVIMWELKAAGPWAYESPGKLIVNFQYVGGGSLREPKQVECEFVSPIPSGDIPELLSMPVNGKFLSRDKVSVAQAAIVGWIEKGK